MRRRGRTAPRRADAFSLLELAAVLALLGLLASLVLPSLNVARGRAAKAAERLVARLELARLRAVATGTTHRVMLDLDEQGYQLEWFVSEARALGEPEVPGPSIYLVEGHEKVPMAPPPGAQAAFHPTPGSYGDWTALLEGVQYERVETTSGWVDRGQVELVFRRDGTTDATEVVLSDSDGATAVLRIEALAPEVRISRGHL